MCAIFGSYVAVVRSSSERHHTPDKKLKLQTETFDRCILLAYFVESRAIFIKIELFENLQNVGIACHLHVVYCFNTQIQ